jgi:hypothetical protein
MDDEKVIFGKPFKGETGKIKLIYNEDETDFLCENDLGN